MFSQTPNVASIMWCINESMRWECANPYRNISSHSKVTILNLIMLSFIRKTLFESGYNFLLNYILKYYKNNLQCIRYWFDITFEIFFSKLPLEYIISHDKFMELMLIIINHSPNSQIFQIMLRSPLSIGFPPSSIHRKQSIP